MLVLVVLGSLLVTSLKPLYGSGIALGLALILQVIFPGYFLARVLGLLRRRHPVVQFVWIIACGFGLTVVLGGVLRYLNTPIPIYLLVLHGIMFTLALLKTPAATFNSAEEDWHFERRHVPLYLLLALTCALMLWVGFQRSRIHYGIEVPTIYAAQAETLAREADQFATPDRWIGLNDQQGNRSRWDGWTYSQAAWSWASGIPTVDLLWHDTTPVLIWVLPLIAFATAYVLSQREDVGVWSAVTLTLFAFCTIDSVVYPRNGSTLFFGASTVFLDTVRAASTVFIVPLAIFALLSFIKQLHWRILLPLLLLGHALAFMRVRQIFILEIVAFVTIGVWWLASPRRRTSAATLLTLVLLSFTILPIQLYVQPSLKGSIYLDETHLTTTDPAEIVADANTDDRFPVLEGLYYRIVRNIPLIGDTFVIDPATWFYTPFIGTAMVLGLAAGWRWRRSVAVQYIFGTTAIITILVFVPGITAFVTKVFGSAATINLISGLNFALPVPFSIGFAVAWLTDRTRQTRWLTPVLTLVFAFALLVIAFDPFQVLYASVKDQIQATNQVEQRLEIMPFEQQLLVDAKQLFDVNVTTKILTVERQAGYLEEVFPNVFTPARESPEDVVNAMYRLLGNDVPFVDVEDVAYLGKYDFDYAVVTSETLAAVHLRLQPDRFEPVLTSSGFLVFRVNGSPTVTPEDQLFSRMNDLYAALDQPRWYEGTFSLARSADASQWTDVALAWRDRLAGHGGDLDRFGLAMTEMLAGDDKAALPLWETLDAAHPEVPFFAQAVAYTRFQLGADHALVPLLRDLGAPQAIVRVIAARTLLTDTFFYLLSDEQIDRIIAVTQNDALTWNQLATWNQPDAVRQRAALLASVKRWDVVDAWLSDLLPIEVSPSDLITQAAIRLMRDDVDGALALLQPATGADWVAPRRYLHPDRWSPENNTAARLYDQLRVERANPTAEPGETSLLALTEPGAGLVMQPQVEQDDRSLTVTATFGSFVPAYLPQTWRALVVSPDASVTYGSTDVPANPDERLTLKRAALTVPLPADLPSLTPARVIVQALYSDALVYDSATVDTVLNRPPAAQMPSEAVTTPFRFGDHIALAGYAASIQNGTLDLTLYWETDAQLPENYQVFVHVIDANGMAVAQNDSAPVDNRYPTSAWRTNTLIADAHQLPLELCGGSLSGRDRHVPLERPSAAAGVADHGALRRRHGSAVRFHAARSHRCPLNWRICTKPLAFSRCCPYIKISVKTYRERMLMKFYRQLSLLVILLCFTTAYAQTSTPSGVCTDVMQQAMAAVGNDCAPTGRNQACYGYVSLEATPRTGVQNFAFANQGDLASVGDLASLRLSRLNTEAQTWGIALMKIQANLPDALPGQNVTFLLFGDVQIDNAVDSATTTIDITSNGGINVRSGPGTGYQVAGSLAKGEATTANGRSANSSWLRIQIPDSDSLGWVSASLVTPASDVSALAVIDPSSAETPFKPMQAFYFQTGITDTSCNGAPQDGILIQTPEGTGQINLRANDVDIQLGSTAYLQAQASNQMTISVVEGEGHATADGKTVAIPAGSQVSIPIDENMKASGAPGDVQPYDASLANLPVQVLPKTITVAPPATADQIAAGEPDGDRANHQLPHRRRVPTRRSIALHRHESGGVLRDHEPSLHLDRHDGAGIHRHDAAVRGHDPRRPARRLHHLPDHAARLPVAT